MAAPNTPPAPLEVPKPSPGSSRYEVKTDFGSIEPIIDPEDEHDKKELLCEHLQNATQATSSTNKFAGTCTAEDCYHIYVYHHRGKFADKKFVWQCEGHEGGKRCAGMRVVTKRSKFGFVLVEGEMKCGVDL